MEKEQEFYKQDMEMLHRLCMIKQLGVPMMNLSDIASLCHVHTQEDVDTLFRLRERNLIVFEEANGALQRFDITSEGLLETDWLNYFSSAIIDFLRSYWIKRIFLFLVKIRQRKQCDMKVVIPHTFMAWNMRIW